MSCRILLKAHKSQVRILYCSLERELEWLPVSNGCAWIKPNNKSNYSLSIYYCIFNLLNNIQMKSIILLGVYLLSFIIIYMMMSLVPLVFSDTSYVGILRNNNWTIMYSLFFGWWMSIFPAREYYLLNQSYLDRVF